MEDTIMTDESLTGAANQPDKATSAPALQGDITTPSSMAATNPAANPATNPAGPVVMETNTQNFGIDVIEASQNIPVVAYFTAPWCEPCKHLGPALEQAVHNAGGLVRLVKINIDENKPLATQLRIQSVPTVFAFKNGQPVDAFQGSVPSSQLKAFIDKMLDGAQPPMEAALDQADAALEAEDGQTAGVLYRDVQIQDPLNERAIAGMIRATLMVDEQDALTALIDSLTPEITAMPLVSSALKAVELSRGSAVDDGEILALEQRIAANETDHQARFDLSLACSAAGQNEAAIEHLLDLLKLDRKWNENAARTQLLKVFEALGNEDPLTQSGRRKMSTVLFS